MKWLILVPVAVFSIATAWALRDFTGTSLIICIAAISLIVTGVAKRDPQGTQPQRE